MKKRPKFISSNSEYEPINFQMIQKSISMNFNSIVDGLSSNTRKSDFVQRLVYDCTANTISNALGNDKFSVATAKPF